jgi:hypothetical protein
MLDRLGKEFTIGAYLSPTGSAFINQPGDPTAEPEARVIDIDSGGELVTIMYSSGQIATIFPGTSRVVSDDQSFREWPYEHIRA